MSADADWTRWGDDWQQQAVVDVDRLRHRVQRKRWRMRLVVIVEWLFGLVAVGQLARLFFMPAVTDRWRIWALVAFVLVAGMAWLSLRLRRGTWQASTADMPDLLRLTARRARAGIRVAWVNIAAFVLLVGITVPFAAPWLAPSRWLHDPALQFMLLWLVGINGLVGGALLVFCIIYMRRQKLRLRKVEAWLRDYAQ